jgi:hypothetical protein
MLVSKWTAIHAPRTHNQPGSISGSQGERKISMLILLIVLLLVFGGGGGYYGHSRWGRNGGIGVVGVVLIVLLLVWFFGMRV